MVEVDTDGLYFIPPDNVVGKKAQRHFVERLSGTLPEGIILVSAGAYEKMISYKKKNYALSGYDGKISIKGSSLISRSMERFGRTYVQQCVDFIINNRIQDFCTHSI